MPRHYREARLANPARIRNFVTADADRITITTTDKARTPRLAGDQGGAGHTYFGERKDSVFLGHRDRFRGLKSRTWTHPVSARYLVLLLPARLSLCDNTAS